MTGSVRRRWPASVRALAGAVLLTTPLSFLLSPAAAAEGRAHQVTLDAMSDMVAAGSPGVVARVDRNVDRGGRHWSATVGVADLADRRPRTPADHFRIGSVTKTFVAVTLLRLEAAGRLSLDDSVEKWLPGVVDARRYDPRSITIRELLNHTSGIYDILHVPDFVSRYQGSAFFEHRYDDWSPRQLVDLATAYPPVFQPGKGWSYSNTDYLLAGMVIHAVTGHSYATEIERQLLRPLGLHETSVPTHSPRLPSPHARDYSHLFVEGADAPTYDVTSFDPSLAGPAGGMISTTRDLNRFFAALLGGRLLPPQQQRELLTGQDTGHGYLYGLGVSTHRLSCGDFWGNDGDIFGSVTYVVSTDHGRHVISLNANDNWSDDAAAERVLDAEMCGTR